MIDSYGRKINYLRVSVTKRCNLNCSYCGAGTEKCEDGLTAAQIEKIVRAFAVNGITKVRLTGGEPLVRSDICEIAKRISGIEGIKKIALTTNGIRLAEYAKALKAAGVSAVNVSLDTTDREQFRAITGYDMLHKVLEGIDECERVGFPSLRLNAVLVKGRNDDQAEKLVDIARNRKIDVRFIELMPFSRESADEGLMVTGKEILSRFPFLRAVNESGEKNVARYYSAESFKGRVGFISPVSEKFCGDCNRIRLLSDGRVKPCLGNDKTFDLMGCLDDEAALRETVREAILSKPMEHGFLCGYASSHGMNEIGG